MIYLEMSRDLTHGGGDWGFGKCVWSPSRKQDGSKWPFWTKVLDVRQGDVIVHLRGIPPTASFVGYSIAATDGYRTKHRPPDPKGWAFADEFLRVDLDSYV